MTADVLLSRLDRVRSTRPGTWIACCPAHDDRKPSLSVRELDDGRVLLHCWVGCAAGDVVAAVGLTLGDLFPPRPERLDHRQRGERRPFPAADALRCVAHEAELIAIAACRMVRGLPPDDDDLQRILLAASRINAALAYAGVSK